jgi:hypothetical protein
MGLISTNKQEQFISQEVVNEWEVQLHTSIYPIHVGKCVAFISTVPEVHVVPLGQQCIVLHNLGEISVTASEHISVAVSTELIEWAS